MSFRWIVVQPVVPDYRDGFFPLMAESLPGLVIVSGEEDFLPSVRKTRSKHEEMVTVRNIFFANRSLLWQRGVVSLCMGMDVVVLNFNTRVISTWAVALSRRLAGRPTLLWGHVTGRNRRLHRVRHGLMRLCDGFITYTDDEREKLARMHPEIRSFTAPNACLPRDFIRFSDHHERKHLLYVGRLEEAKRPLLAIRAFLEAAECGAIEGDVVFYVVGRGTQREEIERLLERHPEGHRVRLMGHIAGYGELENLYSKVRFSLSPGYIGLSAMQSFAFGVPMLVSRNEPHSPEISMCEPGFNTHFISSVEGSGWKDALVRALGGEIGFAPGGEISDRIREQYSFEEMSGRFVEAVRAVSRPDSVQPGPD